MINPVVVNLPISLDAKVTPNSRAHWRTKHKIQQDMKRTTYQMLIATGPHPNLSDAPLPLTLSYIIGLAKRRKAFDTDNAIGGMKWIQDAIAEYFVINDRHMIVGTVDQVRDPEGVGFIEVTISAHS